jgi:predicted ATPase
LEREAFLDVLAGPPGRLILVGGEAGVGKTALVREFSEGRRVLWGACDPLHTPRPLGPLLDLGLRESRRERARSRSWANSPRRADSVKGVARLRRSRPGHGF